MTTDFFDVQKAVYQALVDAGVADGRIHDDVPQSAETRFPYVQIGESLSLPADVQCRDAVEEYIDLHIWSRAASWQEIKDVATAIRAALHQQDLTAGSLSACHVHLDTLRTVRDPDGLTRHGIQTVKIFHAD